MQQQINMDPINNEIKEEEKNDSAISADDSNVNVNLSKRSFTNFASSVKKLMDLNEYIYEDNVLDLEKFHLNHDDELITLVHTIGWWLRNHIDDDETEVKWVRILAKGKPPAVSHDLLFLLQDLDDIDRMLRPLEVGRDVHFDAIIAQPDKILNVSLGHLLKPITPDVRRQGISYLTSMPVPATRFVIDPRTKRWYTDRKPLSFSKNGDNNDG